MSTTPDQGTSGEESMPWKIARWTGRRAIPFCIGMFLMTLLCTFLWEEFLPWKVYVANYMAHGHENSFDYLHPGKWVGADGYPVAVVSRIDGISEKDPDKLKQGWSVALLWIIWCTFFGVSIAVSVLFAMRRGLALRAVLFSVGMVLMTIGSEFAWEEFLTGNVYINTDDVDGGGYIDPGHWVGNAEGFPVIVVKEINQDAPADMSNPDELKTGWSVNRLWVAWWCFFAASVVASYFLSTVPSRIRRYLGPLWNA